MSGTLQIEWENLDHMLDAMQKVGEQSTEIETYFSTYVGSTAGFDYDTCVLKPIGDQVGRLGGLFSDMRGVFADHWKGTTATIVASAKALDKTDDSVSLNYGKYLGQMGPYVPDKIPKITVDVESFEIKDLELPAPGEGSDTFPHDTEWDAASSGYSALRDTINSGIDKINSLGVVSIDRLSDKSLEEFIVFPLSGNYLAIQGNAAACDTAGTAMGSWGTNFSLLSAKTTAALRGQTSASLVLHLNAYNVVMKAVGDCIDAGSGVFSEIAKVSEKIADRVERALVRMFKLLLKVSEKIASRVLGWLGWAMLAADIIEHGLDAITDIWDDIQSCIQIIQMCFDLVDVIKGWAEEAAAELKKFEELSHIAQQLPSTSSGGLDTLPPVNIHTVNTDLKDITYGDKDKAGETDDLNGALTGLDQQSQDASAGADDDDDDPDDGADQLLAPGPMDPLPGPGSDPDGQYATL